MDAADTWDPALGGPWAGVPVARIGWRTPASPAGWMQAATARAAAPLPPDFRWQRAQAYRAGRANLPVAAQWRAQFDALAQRSWQQYRQSVPGTGKLATPASQQAVRGILRDIQNARVGLNDMQLRAKAAELRIITNYLRRPDVHQVQVVASSSAGRTPDLLVTYADGRRRRVEIRTLTGSRPGLRPTAAVPGTRAFDVDSLVRAIHSKATHGQLTAQGGAMRGVRPGGSIALRLEARGPQALALAREAMNRLDAQLKRWRHVEQVEVHTGSQRIVFDRRPDGNFSQRVEAQHVAPAAPATPRVARARRAAPRRRRARAC